MVEENSDHITNINIRFALFILRLTTNTTTDRGKLIGDNPIGCCVDGFSSSFVSFCKGRDFNVPDTLELPLDQLDQEGRYLHRVYRVDPLTRTRYPNYRFRPCYSAVETLCLSLTQFQWTEQEPSRRFITVDSIH